MPESLLLSVGKLASLLAPYALPTLVAVFLMGAVLRWCAFQKFRATYAFLVDVEKQVFKKGRDTGAWPLSAKQILEKALQDHFGHAKNGVKPSLGARLRQKFFRVQPAVRALVSDVIDQFQRSPVASGGTDFQERARFALGHNQGLSTLFGLFPLGTAHRLLSAFPGLVVLVGAFGTVAVVFTVMPELSRTPDSVEVAQNLMNGWTRVLQIGLSHSIFGLFFGGALHLFNRWWDGEKSFHNSVQKLAGVLSLLWQESGVHGSNEGVRRVHKVESEADEAFEGELGSERATDDAQGAERRIGHEEEPLENTHAGPFAKAVSSDESGEERLGGAEATATTHPETLDDFLAPHAKAVPMPDRPDLATPPPAPPAGEDDELWDAPPPEEEGPEREYNAEAASEEAREKDLLDHGIHARHTPVHAPQPADKLPRLEDADLDKLIEDLPLPESIEEEPLVGDELVNSQPVRAEIQRPDEASAPADAGKDELDLALDAIDVPVRPEPPIVQEDTDPERTNTSVAHTKDDLDFFATNALPENWGNIDDNPDDMAIAGAKSGLGEMSFDDLPGENTAPGAKPEEKLDFVGVGPAEDSADRLAVLRHRLKMVEQYVDKAAEDRAAGLINEEMWQEETERWSAEKEKLAREIAELAGKRDVA